MLAIECSKPAATNAVIGIRIATNLSTTLRPASVIQTAMHTRTLHITPRNNAVQNGSDDFAAAICRYVLPIAPSFISVCPEREHDRRKPDGADEVGRAYHDPVMDYPAGRDAAVRRAHRKQIVAGEESRRPPLPREAARARTPRRRERAKRQTPDSNR